MDPTFMSPPPDFTRPPPSFHSPLPPSPNFMNNGMQHCQPSPSQGLNHPRFPMNLRGPPPPNNLGPGPSRGQFQHRGGFGPCLWQMQGGPFEFDPSQSHSAPQRQPFHPDNLFGSGPAGNVQETFPFNQRPQGGNYGNNPPQQGGENHGSRGSKFRGRGWGQDNGGHGRRGISNHNNGHKGQQHNKRKNKQKKDKSDKEDSEKNITFFCDICDRGYKTGDKYKEHIDGHIKCSYDDCSFIASPKLLQLHIKMQHKTGLAKKVWGMESEADVNKWREERKKKYPTASNIAKKEETMKEKATRGELIQTKDFSKMRGGGRGRGGMQRGRGRGGRGGRGRWRDFDNERQGEQDKAVTKSKGKDDIEEDSDDEAPEELKTCKSTTKEEVQIG